MSKVIYTRGCNTLLHTTKPTESISYQKLVNLATTTNNGEIFKKFFNDRVKLSSYKYAVVSPEEVKSTIYVVNDNNENAITSKYNAIITNKSNIILVGYTTTDCLVGLTSFDGRVRCIIYASFSSLTKGIIQKSIAKFANYGISSRQISAYIGFNIIPELKTKIKEDLLSGGVDADDIMDIFSPEYHQDSKYNLVFARC